MDLTSYIRDQIQWSKKAFGEGRRREGLLRHIESEIKEVRESSDDYFELTEWIDIIILALDGAWRIGFTPEQITHQLESKQILNRMRSWPMPKSDDEPSFHEK